jgi:SWI/SNF-related matrix-associated actin-dependent regulator of chromatin subfamily A3
VKLIGEMLSIDAKLKSGGRQRNESQQLLNLKKDERGLSLTFPDGTEFGVLNNLASKALEDIITWPSIETDAFVDIRPLRETLGRATKPADAKTRVNITLYGSLDAKEKLGKKLSKEKMYLQRPDSRRHGTIYDNPHIISFPEFYITGSDLQEEEEQNGVPSSNNVLHFVKTISQVYASLTRGTNLQRIEGDGRLKTKLLLYVCSSILQASLLKCWIWASVRSSHFSTRMLTEVARHQEQALDFMLQREDGPIQPAFSLWKPLTGEDEGW